MAYISFQPSDNFSTKLYTGNSSTNAITGVGFQPDCVWLKSYDTAGTNHYLNDSVRGVNNQVYPNLADANATSSTVLTAFDADGFTLGANGDTNGSSKECVSWNWKAGTSHSGATTGTGTAKTYTASVNTTSGFSITKYTGNGSTGHTIPHNLGAAPDCLIVKDLDNSNNWNCYFRPLTDDYILRLNTTDTQANENNRWNADPTSTVFELGDDAHVNGNDRTYIAYCFAPKKGFSKFGEYKGNGNADGPFIYTGFRPSLLIIKSTTVAGQNWEMWDNKRTLFNNGGNLLSANTSAAQRSNSTWTSMDFLSNGFKIRYSDALNNQSSDTYIYMAFAEFPFVSSNSKSGVAK